MNYSIQVNSAGIHEILETATNDVIGTPIASARDVESAGETLQFIRLDRAKADQWRERELPRLEGEERGSIAIESLCFGVWQIIEEYDSRDYDIAADRLRELISESEKPYIVALYLEDRAYGGPEEGGWYYDCGTWIRPRLDSGFDGWDMPRYFDNEADAREYCKRGNAYLKSHNEGRHPISSVLSDGIYTMEIVRGFTPPEHWPERKPQYE